MLAWFAVAALAGSPDVMGPLEAARDAADPGLVLKLAEVIASAEGVPEALVPLLRRAGINAANVWKHREAIPLFRLALDLCESEFECSELVVGDLQARLGNALKHAGDARQAVQLLEEGLGPIREHTAADAPERVHALRWLASAKHAMGQYSEAKSVAVEALEAAQLSATGPDDLALTGPLNDLAHYVAAEGDLQGARVLFERVLSIREAELPEDDPAIQGAVNSLGSLLDRLGENVEAERLLRRGLRLAETSLTPDHPLLVGALHNLGLLLNRVGDLVEAQQLMERALEIVERTQSDDGFALARALNNLATVEAHRGDQMGAIPLLVRSLELRIETLGTHHPGVARAHANLAAAYAHVGRHQEAIDGYLTALGILESTLGPGHQAAAEVHGMLSSVYLQEDALDLALPHAEQSLEIRQKVLPPTHPVLAQSHRQLGMIALKTGDMETAEFSLVSAEKLLRNSDGMGRFRLPLVLVDRVALLIAQGEDDLALELAKEALDLTFERLDPLLQLSSERGQLEALADADGPIQRYLSAGLGAGDATATYAQLLRWKGAARRVALARRELDMAHRSGSSRLLQDMKDLEAIRRDIAAVAYKSGGAADRLVDLVRSKETLERALASELGALEERKSFEGVQLDQVCDALAGDSALVDFVRYSRVRGVEGRPHTEDTYAAFILRSDRCGDVVRVELGSAVEIDAAVASYRDRLLARSVTSRTDRAGAVVRETVWDPLEHALQGVDRMWLVPDGSLATVSFAGLPTLERRYLVEDYAFSYLEHAADLLGSEERTKARRSLVVGRLDYGEPAALDANAVADCRDVFSDLPETTHEIERVARLLRRGGVDVLTGAEATEQALIDQVAERRIVHLATHGFFRGDDCVRAAGTDHSGLAPLTRNGLALSGANLEGGEGGGILTAEEVSLMDLRQTELVVLSACNTGLGEIRVGQGIMGLRRAFAVAGADALLMSLWTVPDTETRQLMTGFYTELRRRDAADALRNAQLGLLEASREAYGEGRPEDWAGFIVGGRTDIRR